MCGFRSPGCSPLGSGCGAGNRCGDGGCSCSFVCKLPVVVVMCEVDVKVAGTVDCTPALNFIPPAVGCGPVALGGAVDVGYTT